jgi:tungstate transport system ATP-binding protein
MDQIQPMLEGRNLKVVRGGVTILDVPSVALAEAGVLAVVGPNGAGKTTLLQSLSYLLKPLEGQVLFRGRKVGRDCPVLEYRRAVAMVFQEPLLFDTTVFENVASGLKIRGLKGPEMRSIVMKNLDLFGISHLKDRSARTLSGGEAQRTSLARGFATKPQIMFLDEPFASLDPQSKESLISDLQTILEATKTTNVLVTHDLMDALRLSDRIAVMASGRISQIGPPDEVINHPIDEFVASFVGVETILPAVVLSANGTGFIADVKGNRIEAVGRVEKGDKIVLCVRPENVVLSKGAPGTTSARNHFKARVAKIARMGIYEKIDLELGFPLISYITTHSLNELGLEKGTEVTASFKATAIHVIKVNR